MAMAIQRTFKILMASLAIESGAAHGINAPGAGVIDHWVILEDGQGSGFNKEKGMHGQGSNTHEAKG